MSRQFSARVQLGCVIAAGALLQALYAGMHRLNDLKLYVVEFIALALGAGVVYLISLCLLEHSCTTRLSYLLLLTAAIGFRLTLLPLEPSLSDDIHRYRWDGRIQNHGWNPYTVSGRDPRLAAQLVFRLTDKLLPGAAAFKLPFALADLLILLLLASEFRGTEDGAFRLAVYAWNPLVIVEYVGSAHNDALAVAGVVAAVLIIRRHPAVSTIPLTAAAWGLALWLAWKRAEPERAVFLLFGTILLFAPNGYSSYFTWVVPFLCYSPNAAWLLLTVLQFLS